MRKRSLFRRMYRVALGGSALFFAATTIGGYAGALWWVLELVSHFRLQFACALAITALALAVARKWTLLCVAGLPLVLNIYEVGRLHSPNARATNPDGLNLSIVHLNAWQGRNTQPKLISEYVRSSGADVVLILESSEQIMAALELIIPQYQLVAQPDHERPYRSVVLIHAERSSWKIVGIEDVELKVAAHDGVGLGTTIRLEMDGEKVAILHPHVTAPGIRERHLSRQSEIGVIADWVKKNPHNPIVIGDLNCAPWSSTFGRLLANTRLLNSQRGFGVQGSWPRRPPHFLTWVFTIPIDHCLHGPSMTTLDRRVGPFVGSDHLPLTVTLRLSRNTTKDLPSIVDHHQ